MSAAGIIFSNIHDSNIPELTTARAIGSIPFGCRYRLIDFAISNMVNSDIGNISIITNSNYLSLMDHIGSGKDWDLARRNGGIKMLPPNVTPYGYHGREEAVSRLAALKNVNLTISRITDDYIVLSDCDMICNIDLNDIIKQHIAENANITIAVKSFELMPDTAKHNTIVISDEDGLVRDILTYPNHFSGTAEVSLNILVMSTAYLQQIVRDAIAYNYSSLTRDISSRSLKRDHERANIHVYRYDGYYAEVTSLSGYFSHSMDLIHDMNIRRSLFGVRSRPVLTKIRNSPPTYYSENSSVRNSLIADGCVIEGTVENSILFRGVKVGRNAKINNSIIMQDGICGENVTLNCVISDKNVVIRDGITLSGVSSQPYYISKGRML